MNIAGIHLVDYLRTCKQAHTSFSQFTWEKPEKADSSNTRNSEERNQYLLKLFSAPDNRLGVCIVHLFIGEVDLLEVEFLVNHIQNQGCASQIWVLVWDPPTNWAVTPP